VLLVGAFGPSLHEVFATTAEAIAFHRPLVIVFSTPTTQWVSSQAGDAAHISDLIQGCGDLGYIFGRHPFNLGGVTFSVAIAEEMATPLGFPTCFPSPVCEGNDENGEAELPYIAITDAVHAFLRPVSTFRVTAIEQVWPPEHQAQLDKWKRQEGERAKAIKAGNVVPALDVVVFDSKFMHEDARDIRYDLREYWRVKAEGGTPSPALIVPLHSLDPPPSVFNNEAIEILTSDQEHPSPDRATPFDMRWGVDNGSKALKHSFICSNWPKAYQFFDIGNADIKQYEERGFITFVDFDGLPFTHCSVVAQNTVPKPGADPMLVRRRVLGHAYPRTNVVIDGRTYELLSLNSRIDIENEAAVLFSSWGALESKAMSLRRSCLPVVMFKADGDAWYKQFWRRQPQVAEGVASWPRSLHETGHEATVMSLFYDTRLQFGDACAAHRTYRVTYMLIWMLLQDAADRRATNPQVREWQRLQLDLVKAGIITETNLAYCNADGFVDDVMAFILEGEEEYLLGAFLGLMRFLGVKISLKKLKADASAFHVKVMLGFVMDLKRGIGYLDLGWKNRFLLQLDETAGAPHVTLHDLQVIGGKAIRVCCLIKPLRVFLNGIFAAIRGSATRGKTIKEFASIFQYDCKMIAHVLRASPSTQLLYEPKPIASIATGAAYTDCDASTGWGMGFCTIAEDAIYFLMEPWTDEEKSTFDICEMEMITYDFAFKYTPRVAPDHFARQRFEIVGREDNEAVRWALEGNKSDKGAMIHGVKSVLCSQVQHSFLITHIRVATEDNIMADALSRGELTSFLAEALKLGKKLIRMRLTPEQRSTDAYARAKAAFQK
jgi:hypothetical protein